MVLQYHGAPKCNFKPTRQKSDFLKHLKRKTWCACKDCDWSVEKALQGQVDGRTARHQTATEVHGNQNMTEIQGNHNSVDNSTTINIIMPPVYASGSDKEREYLKEHAEHIIKRITAGTDASEADILSRFVRETWCSDQHHKLNNVMSLTTQGNEFIILRMRDGEPQIETLAGREAPEQLVTIAQKVMHQFAVDAAKGYDATKLRPPLPDHQPDKKLDQVAWVDYYLNKKKRERKRVGSVVSSQLRQVGDKASKRQRIMASDAAQDNVPSEEAQQH